MSGKTIEIINTDAEGRLILADGLAYARQLGATHLIDLATLTGAVRVALGPVRVGVLGTDQAFIDSFLAVAKRAGERMWQLPMDDEYRDMIKSTVADVANSGGRFAGAITAAKWSCSRFGAHGAARACNKCRTNERSSHALRTSHSR